MLHRASRTISVSLHLAESHRCLFEASLTSASASAVSSIVREAGDAALIAELRQELQAAHEAVRRDAELRTRAEGEASELSVRLSIIYSVRAQSMCVHNQ